MQQCLFLQKAQIQDHFAIKLGKIVGARIF